MLLKVSALAVRSSLRSAGAERVRLSVVVGLGSVSGRLSLSAAAGPQQGGGAQRLPSERAASAPR